MSQDITEQEAMEFAARRYHAREQEEAVKQAFRSPLPHEINRLDLKRAVEALWARDWEVAMMCVMELGIEAHEKGCREMEKESRKIIEAHARKAHEERVGPYETLGWQVSSFLSFLASAFKATAYVIGALLVIGLLAALGQL